MADRAIDNPIVNSPYAEPTRHFRFDEQGITSEVTDGRRPSAYFVPIPRPRKQRRQQRQLELTTEWTLDRLKENDQVNQVRARVKLWRQRGYPDVTPTTRALLEHWSDPERDNPVLFCQREAAETAIYLVEAAQKSGDAWIAGALAERNAEHNAGLPRVAMKMATGSGKTVAMAMLIAWQTLNKVVAPQDARFAKRFLVVTPGITIRDRLRVLLPEDPDNYYRLRDLVPADLAATLGQAKIVITNFHALQLRETRQGRGVSKTTKAILAGGVDRPSPFLETPDQMVTRVCRELGVQRKGQIVVLNDEAHHCYRGRSTTADDVDDEPLSGDERVEAKERNEEARVWFNGLEHVRRRLGVKTVYDLSATPFFLAGSGYREGTLFPWVASDFSLIDAIESGIVKIPRVPVDDDRVATTVTYLELWREIRDALPRRSRKTEPVAEQPVLPTRLEGALQSLYADYERSFARWESSGAANAGETPPVFIVVCNNTNVSRLVFNFIAGWERQRDGQPTVVVPGALPLFSNEADGSWTPRPKTILVDSSQLESGQAMSEDFKRIAAPEIEEFKAELRQRFPGRDTGDLTDEDLLREVMNTVGKKGKLGEGVRCVVSVSMLTEGWDANTVTHILGVRAFGTQLLCEQVVGRGLRRRSYAVNDAGFFEPEYAEVYGVPFSFIPASGSTGDPPPRRPVTRVRAEPDRSEAQIVFPRLAGYRVELPDEPLYADFGEDSRLVLSKAQLPMVTDVSGVVGEPGTHRLDDLRNRREQQVAFRLAGAVLDRYLRDGAGNERPWLFPRVVDLVREWLRASVDYHDDTFPGLLLLSENAQVAVEKISHGFFSVAGDRHERLLPLLRPYDAVGSTEHVDFDTSRPVFATDVERCHVTHVVVDSGWERVVAQALEELPGVAAYVKNDHLGFAVPYTHAGQTRHFYPDFLVRLAPRDGDGVVHTLVVEVSGGHKPAGPTEEKSATMRELWVPAVNNHGGFGRWGYCEITEPTRCKADLTAAFQVLYADGLVMVP